MLIHSNINITPSKNFYYIKVQIPLILISIISVRFNIINSIHNFISLDSQNQYLYYILVIVLCLLSTAILFFSKVTGHNKRFIVSNSFVLCLCIFYLVYIYNILNLDILKASYNIQINFKNTYLNIFIFATLLYSLKNKNPNQSFLLYVFYFIFLKKNLNFIDIISFFIIFIILSNFFKNLSTKIQIKHVLLVLLTYLIIHQLYIFNKDYISFESHSVTFIKSNNHYHTESFNRLNGYGYNHIDLKRCIDYITDTKKNLQVFDSGFFKGVFEKKMYSTLFLDEFYSYNLQQLSQVNGL